MQNLTDYPVDIASTLASKGPEILRCSLSWKSCGWSQWIPLTLLSLRGGQKPAFTTVASNAFSNSHVYRNRWGRGSLLFIVLLANLISAFSSITLKAQVMPSKDEAVNQRKGIRQYVHSVWSSTSGFPANRISAITQTTDGYLWLGTDEGLVRLDGGRVTIFDQTNTQAMT